MGRAYRLETFDTDDIWTAADDPLLPPALTAEPSPQLEDVRLEAFEKGYKAGWDDSEKAQSGDTTRIGAELARNLEDLGFTLHEAREHVLRTLSPLMSEVVDRLLPRLLRESVAPTVLETVLPLAEVSSDSEMEIVTAPESRAAIESILNDATPMAVRVIEEDTLTEGQVYLRLGAIEKEIDLSAIHDCVSAALSEVFEIQTKVRTHG